MCKGALSWHRAGVACRSETQVPDTLPPFGAFACDDGGDALAPKDLLGAQQVVMAAQEHHVLDGVLASKRNGDAVLELQPVL